MTTLPSDVQKLVDDFLTELSKNGVHATVLLDEVPESVGFANTTVCASNMVSATAVVTNFPTLSTLATSMHDCVAHSSDMRKIVGHVHHRMQAESLIGDMLHDELNARTRTT